MGDIIRQGGHSLNIHVLLFASYKEQAQTDTFSVSLIDGSSLGDAIQEVKSKFPSIKCDAERIVAAVNEEYSKHERTLVDGDTIALIPPVSGWALLRQI